MYNISYKNNIMSCIASTTQKSKSKSGGFTDISQIVYLHSLRSQTYHRRLEPSTCIETMSRQRDKSRKLAKDKIKRLQALSSQFSRPLENCAVPNHLSPTLHC